MTDDHLPAESDDPPTAGDTVHPGALFARLADELSELGFEANADDETGTLTYTATDSTTEIMLDPAGEPRRAVLAKTNVDGTGDWEITFTAATPEGTQLVILYAALHPDHSAEGIEAAATALAAAKP